MKSAVKFTALTALKKNPCRFNFISAGREKIDVCVIRAVLKIIRKSVCAMYIPVSLEMARQISLDEKIRKGLISDEDAEMFQNVLNNRKNARRQMNKYIPSTKPSKLQNQRDKLVRTIMELQCDAQTPEAL